MLELSTQTEQTMSSLEIAKLTEKEHRNVLADIRKVLDEVGIGLLKFQQSYINEQNKPMPCYHLPRLECDLVISGYSVKYRLAIIKRWHELEAKQRPVLKTALQLAREQVLLLEEIENMKLAHKSEVIELENKALDYRFELVDVKEKYLKESIKHGLTGIYNLPRT
jgi:Rha family phage regulatory protein